MTGLLLSLALPVLAQTHGATWESRPGMLRLGGLVLFFGGRGPLSYQLPAAGSAPEGAIPAGTVSGSSCQHGLSVPIALTPRSARLSAGRGYGGYEKALSDLMSRRPDLRGIYDAKVDDHHVSILGIYRRLCTEITARGFK